MNLAWVGQERPLRFVLLMAITALSWTARPSHGAIEDAQVSAAMAEKAWREGLTLIQQGRFEDATSKIARLTGSQVAADKLTSWLDAWNEQAQIRAEMTLADYEKYVALARKYHAQDDLPKALDYAVRAVNNAVSKDAFRQEGWVGKLIDGALTRAAELRVKEQWLDALGLYYQIGEILEHDANVRKRIRECRTHARLDAIYTEDSKWQERLAGIEQRMVEEAFREIDQKYVEEANFRAITEAGLEQMLLLTESVSLRKLFKSLEDDPERGTFQARVRANLAKVRNADKVDFKVAREQFLNALTINRQTLQLPEALVINEYMEGCSEELDEFTTVIWPTQMPEFNKHTRGDFTGVGIQIRQRYNTELKGDEIVVVTPIEDSSAYAAGIQAGDVITMVNGQPILGISLNKAVETITGPVGTSVTLGIRRESEPQELEFTLKRITVKIQSIKGFARDPADDQKWLYMIDPEYGIAYVRVVSFQENTVEDFVKTVDLLARNNLRGLILDLRFDPGGLLRTAVLFAELFLDRNETIVSTRGLNSPKWEIAATRRGPYRDLPLVVLANDSSASASEILVGAIKDHHRGLIVGERTYGKFSVQNLIQLARTEAHLKLTTARYYLPSGRSLHRDEDSVTWGVEPDIPVPLVTKEVAKIVQAFRKRDIIGSRAETLAQKVLSDEEADFNAEVERAKKSAATTTEPQPATTAPAAGETSQGGAPASQPGDQPDAVGNAPKGEEVDRNDRPDIDPQLDAALLVMRAHLLDVSDQLVAKTSAPSKEAHPE
ncbi:MAG: S41 family peptidase [Planctomycetota bacterium]